MLLVAGAEHLEVRVSAAFDVPALVLGFFEQLLKFFVVVFRSWQVRLSRRRVSVQRVLPVSCFNVLLVSPSR
jgi:hypothetical protein